MPLLMTSKKSYRAQSAERACPEKAKETKLKFRACC